MCNPPAHSPEGRLSRRGGGDCALDVRRSSGTRGSYEASDVARSDSRPARFGLRAGTPRSGPQDHSFRLRRGPRPRLRGPKFGLLATRARASARSAAARPSAVHGLGSFKQGHLTRASGPVLAHQPAPRRGSQPGSCDHRPGAPASRHRRRLGFARAPGAPDAPDAEPSDTCGTFIARDHGGGSVDGVDSPRGRGDPP
jgi:hypothetical protein